MSRRIQVNRLAQDELTYELAIRGIAAGNCEEMRHRLAMAFQMEKTGESIAYPTYPYTFDEDGKAVDDKVKELIVEVGTLSGGRKSGPVVRCQTKLSHVLNRIDHMDPGTDADKQKKKSEWLAMTLTLLKKLDDQVNKFEEKQLVPPGLSLLETGSATGSVTTGTATAAQGEDSDDDDDGASFSAGLPGAANSSAVGHGQTSTCTRSIHPSKWNLQFAGDKRGLSLSAFLEKCEELRIARHVSKDVLLESGVDLFVGKAYQFYKAYRNEVTTWDEFVDLLREEFQPHNYNEKLFEEIRRRTQGPEESIGIYLAVMLGYFKRLTCPISEQAKLKILLRNLAPFYQSQLALVDITSISQLRSLCRRLEERRESVENFSQPPRRSSHLEPDLAYVTEEEPGLLTLRLDDKNNHVKQDSDKGNSTERKDIVCFRCKKPGHRAIGCLLPKPKFCFRCKKDGVTVKTCPNCRSGNGGGRS